MENTDCTVKKKNRTKGRVIITVITLLTLAFIWIHSCIGQEGSAEESGFVYELLCPFFEIFMGKGNVTEHFIRKMAHFTEFFALGFELMIFMRLYLKSSMPVLMINAWALSTFCALIDETIQIFSGRGPAVADVWLDSAGAMTGVLLGLAAVLIFEHKKS